MRQRGSQKVLKRAFRRGSQGSWKVPCNGLQRKQWFSEGFSKEFAEGILRRGLHEGAHREQKHALSESTTPKACVLVSLVVLWPKLLLDLGGRVTGQQVMDDA